MSCLYCDDEVYIKAIQYLKPLCAPMTKAEELRQQLQDLTGEVYLPIKAKFCPMCGERKEQNDKG